MSFFVKKSTPSKKGLYLQIYQNTYIPGKGNRNRSYQVVGYFDELKKQGIEDPIKYAQDIADSLNEKHDVRKDRKIGDVSFNKNLGYFILKSMIDYLDVDTNLSYLTSNRKTSFKTSDFIRSMIYAQVINPSSKHKAFEKVLPSIYNCKTFSYDQILDTINYIGNDYQKFIEIFNIAIDKKWERKTNKAYFDCTNYYFEIDLPFEDKQKGPSKEERHLPIISQALLLDEEQIPLAMSMFPGNESEKPHIRKTIENIKSRYDISSKIVQVADKGLNCARNIYYASIEANDGYIFSKSVHGKNLSKEEKTWVLLDNEHNIWHTVLDKNNKVIYKYKECIDTYNYSFLNEEGKTIKFSIVEKRIVTYNPTLAKKQRIQIQKEIDKAKNISSYKESEKDAYGDSIKYVKFLTSNKEGEIIKPVIVMNEAKIEEDLAFAGYNLLVTSEIDKSAEEIYKAYHGLWRIEESFRIMKSYLEARPVYLQNKESIYGHFTICYLALLILRLLEIKVFNEELSVADLISFIRSYNITETIDGSFINNAYKSNILDIIQKQFGLAKLDNALLKKKDIENILNAELYI